MNQGSLAPQPTLFNHVEFRYHLTDGESHLRFVTFLMPLSYCYRQHPLCACNTLGPMLGLLYVNSFNPPKNLQVLSLFSWFYRWRNWGPERWNELSRITIRDAGTGISHFIALCRCWVLFAYILKVCGNPALSKPISAIFPTIFAQLYFPITF